METVMEYVCRRDVQVGMAIGISLLGYLAYKKRKNLPPGPIGLPFIGGVLELKSGVMHADFLRLGKTYGDIVSIYANDRLIVGLNSYDAIKEAFVKKADSFSDRIEGFVQDDLQDFLFLPAYSHEWKMNRKNILAQLKTFGFGTTKGEANMTDEIEIFLKVISESSGIPIACDSLVEKTLANITLRIVFQKHYPYDHPELAEFLALIMESLTAFDETASTLFLPSVGRSAKQAEMTARYRKAEGAVIAYNKKRIQEHIDTMDPEDPRDFIDAFIISKGVENLDQERFAKTLAIAILPDPILTAGTALRWAIFCIGFYSDARAKLQQEVDEVVGSSRRPCLGDKRSMPYTDAFICEVFRMYPSLAVTMPHVNKTQETILGYTIPSKSILFGNIWAINRDPKCYVDPDTFKPERFLNSEGKAKTPPEFMTFSQGHRRCPGEIFATMELFLFVTYITQEFDITVTNEDEKSNPSNPDFEGIVPRPPNYKVIAKPRM